MRRTISILFWLPVILSNARASAPQASDRVHEAVAAVYGNDRYTALADFRLCQDFTSCFQDACQKSASTPGITIRELKTASRPFIMPNRSGSPAKGAVVLGHGLGGSPYDVSWIADELSKHGYHVIAPLLPSHGADYYSQDQLVNAEDYRLSFSRAVALAKKLFPGLPLSLGGSSTSGALAVDYLQRHKEEQDQFRNMLLFDPALALDPIAESALNRELIRGLPVARASVSALEALAIPWTSEGDNSSPSWFGFKGSVHARPLLAIINDVRKAAGSQTISTPTYSVFSNGKDNIVPIVRKFAKIVDPGLSRKLLYGSENSGGGILASTEKGFLDLGKADPARGRLRPIIHRQVTLKEDIGGCRRALTAGDNPYFEEMMSQVTAFMRKHESTSGSGPAQVQRAVK